LPATDKPFLYSYFTTQLFQVFTSHNKIPDNFML